MLHHIVVIRLQAGVSDEQADTVLAALAALPAAVPQIRSFSCGRNLGLTPNAADLALHATFDDADDFAAYRTHPAHVAFGAEVLRPVMESVTPIQFTTPE
jgi:hypothetical protein